MGAWGVTNFENDTALDWVSDLADGDDTGMIEQTLESALGEGDDGGDDDEYLDADVCSAALAAAEIVAALRGRPANDLPEGAKVWIAEYGKRIEVTRDLIDTAHDAIARIAADSELRDVWMESESAQAWEDVLCDLQRRIGTD